MIFTNMLPKTVPATSLLTLAVTHSARSAETIAGKWEGQSGRINVYQTPFEKSPTPLPYDTNAKHDVFRSNVGFRIVTCSAGLNGKPVGIMVEFARTPICISSL